MRRVLSFALLSLVIACGSDASDSAAPDAGDAEPATDAGTADNEPPIADAGLDIAADVGNQILLSGGGSSDPDGDALEFSWRFVSLPAGSSTALLNADTEGPSFIADVPGAYVVELTVNDGTVDSDPDAVTVVASATGANLKPTADAGPDRQAVTGQTVVQLDGTNSSDPEGASLNFLWVRKSFPAGSTASLNTNDPALPTFVPDRDGEYVFRLQVNDGVTVSDIDEVSIFADSQDAVAIVAGDGQTDTVNTALPQQITARVTNEFGMPVQSVSLQFSITDGNGSLSTSFGFTNSSGQASTTLTLGTTAGTNTVTVTCVSCATTTTDSVSATGTPDVAATITMIDPVDVSVGQTMQLTAAVADQFGNLVTSDSTTQFTITASGAGAVALSGATQGTIDSGEGTSSVLVTVSGGEVVLGVTNDTAEVVTFSAIDSQALGLTFLGTEFDKTTSVQPLACSGGTNTFSFDVTNVGAPTTDALVAVTATGDLNASFEVIDVFLESTAGTNYGEVYDNISGGCTATTDSVTVPQADLQTFAADGTIGLQARTDFSVSCSCATNEISIRITMHTVTHAEFL